MEKGKGTQGKAIRANYYLAKLSFSKKTGAETTVTDRTTK
jgi:hypothetical protein